jgi:hypothetical protein
MNKRLREKFDSFDLKSFLLAILFSLIALFLFFYFSNIRDRFRTEDKEKFKGRTTGEIINVEKQEKISNGKYNGTRIYVDGYKITYKYTVDGKTFEGVDIIALTAMNQKLLTGLLERGTNNTCIVSFDSEEPRKSLLLELQN